MKQQRTRIPIGAFLIIGFGGLVAAAALTVFGISYFSAVANTRELMGDVAASWVDTIASNIEHQLRPVTAQADWIAAKISSGEIRLDNEAALSAFIKGALAGTPQVSGIAILDPQLRLRRFPRDEASVSPYLNIRSQPRAREILEQVRKTTGPAWTAPFWVAALKRSVLTQRTPLYRDGQFLGALVQAVALADLSASLALAVSSEQTPFVLIGMDRVLAHPRFADWRPEDPVNQPLPTPQQLGDRVIAGLPGAEPPGRPGPVEPKDIAVRTVVAGGHTHIVLQRRLTGYGDTPWVVGTYFSSDIGEQWFARLRWAIFAGAAVLIAALAGAIVIGRLVGRPVQDLAAAAAHVEGGHLDRVENLSRSPLRELDDAGTAFNGMVEGLRERARLRNLFGKFVPEGIAKRLLAEGDGLALQAGDATVLFVDMEGFTALSESLEPLAIINLLNEYFSCLVGIIEDRGGIITQFQGDAILAIFNIPVADPDHAAKAVRAGLEILAATEKRDFLGHRLQCRVGINTGAVVAGNVGAPERKNYTVHGNAVNVAARLERMNKELGTHILVAEKTARLAGLEGLRRVGSGHLRGQQEAVTVYTAAATAPEE